jgi:hypothetical protein
MNYGQLIMMVIMHLNIDYITFVILYDNTAVPLALHEVLVLESPFPQLQNICQVEQGQKL